MINKGAIVRVYNQIDPSESVLGVVKLVEVQDDIMYAYVVADEDVINDKWHPVIGWFYDMYVIGEPYIEILHSGTSY